MSYKFDYQYFGNINYYFELIKITNYEFELYDTYEKMSFRNRCRILGANGPIDLSIPVVGGREIKTVMKDVRICYREDWRARHFKTLVSCYNRSPWFQEYRLIIEDMYSKKFEYLYELDFSSHLLIAKLLKLELIKIDISSTEEFQIGSNLDNSTDFRGKFLPRLPNPFNLKV
ncbi:MAG: WbqC family protein, partial [Flavitalea sp.]